MKKARLEKERVRVEKARAKAAKAKRTIAHRKAVLGAAYTEVSQLGLAELKDRLKTRELPCTGVKTKLVARLRAAMMSE